MLLLNKRVEMFDELLSLTLLAIPNSSFRCSNYSLIFFLSTSLTMRFFSSSIKLFSFLSFLLFFMFSMY